MKTINSCLMLATGLYTPVSLSCLFNDQDFFSSTEGIIHDPHITLFYAKDQDIPVDNLYEDIETILGPDSEDFFESLKKAEFHGLQDMFTLGKFSNPESDWLVLKLRTDNELYKHLQLINKGLSVKYNIKSDYNEYRPHLSLARLQRGAADDYIDSEKMFRVFRDSKVSFEDFLLSHDTGVSDYKTVGVTHNHTVERYFRQSREERENKKG